MLFERFKRRRTISSISSNMIEETNPGSKSTFTDKEKRQYFQSTLSTIREMFNTAQYTIEKAEILNYAIDVIGREIAYSVSARMLYHGESPDYSDYDLPLISLISPEIRNLSLENVNVISETWEITRLGKAIPQVHLNGFRQKMNYYTANYYPDIKLAVVENGRHHLSVAAVKNSGSAQLQIYRLKDAFPHLTTDGAYWFRDNQTPSPVFDYRIAVLYELAHIKHSLNLPEDLYDCPNELFPASEDRSFSPNSYSLALAKIGWLQLELKINQFQLDSLQGKKDTSTLASEIESLRKESAKLKELITAFSSK